MSSVCESTIPVWPFGSLKNPLLTPKQKHIYRTNVRLPSIRKRVANTRFHFGRLSSIYGRERSNVPKMPSKKFARFPNGPCVFESCFCSIRPCRFDAKRFYWLFIAKITHQRDQNITNVYKSKHIFDQYASAQWSGRTARLGCTSI